jgi:Carboxypeptidase regulatory-like domain
VKRSAVPILLIALTLFSACARGPSAGSDDGEVMGTIRGAVLLAPTCPVESIESPCPGRPLADVRVLVVDDEGNVRASTMSDDDGSFALDVAPGTYVLTASIHEDPARSVKPVRVDVVAGEVVQSDVVVDSGIR